MKTKKITSSNESLCRNVRRIVLSSDEEETEDRSADSRRQAQGKGSFADDEEVEFTEHDPLAHQDGDGIRSFMHVYSTSPSQYNKRHPTEDQHIGPRLREAAREAKKKILLAADHQSPNQSSDEELNSSKQSISFNEEDNLRKSARRSDMKRRNVDRTRKRAQELQGHFKLGIEVILCRFAMSNC